MLPRLADARGCLASAAGDAGPGGAESSGGADNAVGAAEGTSRADAVKDAQEDRPDAHEEPDTEAACVTEAHGGGRDTAGCGMGLADRGFSAGGSGDAAAIQEAADDSPDASMDPADGDGGGTRSGLAPAPAAWNACDPASPADSPAAAAECAWDAGGEADSLRGSPARSRSSSRGRLLPAWDTARGAGQAPPGCSPQAPSCGRLAPPAAAAKLTAVPGAQALPASKAGAPPLPRSACPAAVVSSMGSGAVGRRPLGPHSAGDVNAGQGGDKPGYMGAAHMHARQRSSPEHAGAEGLLPPSRHSGARCFDLGV